MLFRSHIKNYCEMQEDERARLEQESGVTWTEDVTVADPLLDALKLLAAEMRANGRDTCSSLELLEKVQGWASLRNTSAKLVANAARHAGWLPHRTAGARGWQIPV